MLHALFALFTSIALASPPPPPGVGLVTHELTATAPLTGNAVWDGLAAGEAALLACVGDPAAPLPTVIRALDLRWTVAPGGQASGLSVEGAEPAGPGLTPCLAAAIGSVTWADPGAAPSTMTARLMVLHNAYATLTRAPASMLPPRMPGDSLNQPSSALGSPVLGKGPMKIQAAVTQGKLDPIAATHAAEPLRLQMIDCFMLRTAEGPQTVRLVGTYTKRGAVKSVLAVGPSAEPMTSCAQSVLSTLDMPEAGVVEWTVGFSEGPAAPESSGPVVLGALDKSVIDAVIKRHTNIVRACYTEGLKENKALGGKVTLKFTIAADGSVAKAEVKTSTLSAPAVELCMAQAFRRMTFPPPKGDGIVIVTYPFVFSPG